MKDTASNGEGFGKFENPYVTAKGDTRASVALTNPETLWFNTGTLCNITCENCYIESSPTNDRLEYLSVADVQNYLNQIKDRNWPIREIAFTGGEPYMNPEMNDMTRACLEAGYDVLILTNAMQPMQRKSVKKGLLQLQNDFPDKLTMRVSIDHWTPLNHDKIRGIGAFERTLQGMFWLRDNSFTMATAGRSLWDETDQVARAGYAALFAEHNFLIDAKNPGQTVLFPEMDETVDVPEITTDCWGILNKSPDQIMCSSSRMIVKRKGAKQPAVLACTLLPYSAEFELGSTLAEAEGSVQLNHPHCAKFCVLGGASCSA